MNILSTKAFVVIMVTSIFNPILKWKFLIPAIIKQQNNPIKAQKHISLYIKIAFSIPLMIAVFGPFFTSLESGLISQTRTFISYMSITMGNMFLIGIFFGSFMIRALEKWASFLPFEEKHLDLSMTRRTAIISILSILSTSFFTMAPLVRTQSDDAPSRGVGEGDDGAQRPGR